MIKDYSGPGFEEAFLATLKVFRDRGIKVQIIGLQPKLKIGVRCAVNAIQRGEDINRCGVRAEDAQDPLRSIDAFFARVAASDPGVSYTRPVEFMCKGNDCPPVIDGVFVYSSDGLHLSHAGADLLAPRALPASIENGSCSKHRLGAKCRQLGRHQRHLPQRFLNGVILPATRRRSKLGGGLMPEPDAMAETLPPAAQRRPGRGGASQHVLGVLGVLRLVAHGGRTAASPTSRRTPIIRIRRARSASRGSAGALGDRPNGPEPGAFIRMRRDGPRGQRAMDAHLLGRGARRDGGPARERCAPSYGPLAIAGAVSSTYFSRGVIVALLLRSIGSPNWMINQDLCGGCRAVSARAMGLDITRGEDIDTSAAP